MIKLHIKLMLLFAVAACSTPSRFIDVETKLLIDNESLLRQVGSSTNASLREPFFKHALVYPQEVIINGEFTDKFDDTFSTGSRLFSVEPQSNVPFDGPITNISPRKIYCGWINKEKSQGFLAGQQPRARCFQDFNNDGEFDTAYAAIMSSVNPDGIRFIRKDNISLTTPISYKQVPDNERKVAGYIWFSIYSSFSGRKQIGVYRSGPDEKDGKLIPNSNIDFIEGETFEYQGSKVRMISRTDETNFNVSLEKPIIQNTPYYVFIHFVN